MSAGVVLSLVGSLVTGLARQAGLHATHHFQTVREYARGQKYGHDVKAALDEDPASVPAEKATDAGCEAARAQHAPQPRDTPPREEQVAAPGSVQAAASDAPPAAPRGDTRRGRRRCDGGVRIRT